jgi:4-hydroxy-3-methylbut-2-en-1-yl diphosphate reductase
MKILLANPRGFCAGVDRAIEIVERALELLGAPVYVRHEIVHNDYVVNDLRNRGAVFVDELSEVPAGATVIFSAHGVSKAVRNEAIARGVKVIDATCPLVTKVHMQVIRYARLGYECVLIGHRGHPEVEGTLGQYDCAEGGIYLVEDEHDVEKINVKNPNKLVRMSQTTLSVDDTARVISALQARFPEIIGPQKDDICYATQNRQDAVKDLATRAAVVLVVGSVNSSNSNRLRELAERLGCAAYLIDTAAQIQREWVEGKSSVGVTAGASAPEKLVREVIARLQEWGGELAQELPGREETIVFGLPRELRPDSKDL